jgi:hypothetical protein
VKIRQDENFNLQAWNNCDNHLLAVDICAALLHAHSGEPGKEEKWENSCLCLKLFSLSRSVVVNLR